MALAGCTDINSVTDNVGLDFGQVYDCDMVETFNGSAQSVQYTYHPCLADDADARAFEQAWVDNDCKPAIGATGGDCSGVCQLSALGLNACTL